MYWIETVHGVVVDVVKEVQFAKQVANRTNKHPLLGSLPCRVYTFNNKSQKEYVI